jgi:hypothetical protein
VVNLIHVKTSNLQTFHQFFNESTAARKSP